MGNIPLAWNLMLVVQSNMERLRKLPACLLSAERHRLLNNCREGGCSEYHEAWRTKVTASSQRPVRQTSSLRKQIHIAGDIESNSSSPLRRCNSNSGQVGHVRVRFFVIRNCSQKGIWYLGGRVRSCRGSGHHLKRRNIKLESNPTLLMFLNPEQ
jgi:hypothetical protein